jgi:hypothetical protein
MPTHHICMDPRASRICIDLHARDIRRDLAPANFTIVYYSCSPAIVMCKHVYIFACIHKHAAGVRKRTRTLKRNSRRVCAMAAEARRPIGDRALSTRSPVVSASRQHIGAQLSPRAGAHVQGRSTIVSASSPSRHHGSCRRVDAADNASLEEMRIHKEGAPSGTGSGASSVLAVSTESLRKITGDVPQRDYAKLSRLLRASCPPAPVMVQRRVQCRCMYRGKRNC